MLGSRAAPQHQRTTRDVTMLSLPSASRPVKPFLPRLVVLILLFLASSSADGASLGRPGSPAEPSADMLKALEYVQSLHRRSDWGLRPPAPPAVHREDPGEAEEGGEDRSEELLRAVLSTLRQTERASGPRGAEGGYPRGPDAADPPHRRTPKPEERDEEEDEDEEEAGYDKRTNENVEEKYTPQSLATLQSVFDELDKLTGSKVAQKRQDEEDDAGDEEEDEEENEDLFNGGNAVFDEMGRDRGPLEEEEEEEEEEDGNNKDYPGLDYIDNNDEEDDEEEDDPSFLVKRSPSDANDLAGLMDYYLLRVLEKTEEEQRKLKEQEEEENRDNLDPRVVYRLLTVAQKYQIPPGDLMDLLKTGNGMSSDKLRKANEAPRAKSRFPQASLKKPYQIPEEQFYGRRPHSSWKIPEERRTEDILRMLGLGGEDASRQPSPLRPRPAGRFGAQRRLPKPLRDDYDDTADQDQDQDQDPDQDRDQDELAAYLAARMLARYPKPALFSNSNKAGRKQEEDGPRGAGSFKKAVEKYFDLMESNRSPNVKRQYEDDGRGEGFENEAVMKLLSYLNPETEESDAKTA